MHRHMPNKKTNGFVMLQGEICWHGLCPCVLLEAKFTANHDPKLILALRLMPLERVSFLRMVFIGPV